MKRYLVLASVLALALLVSLGILVGPVGAGGSGEPAYHITWSLPKISRAICTGYSWDTDLTFTSDQELSKVQLVVTPELKPFVSMSPESFDTVAANVPTGVHIHIAVPTETVLNQTYQGTVHLRIGRKTYPQTLKILLYIAAPLETVTEQAYDRTRELNSKAIDDFYELETTSGAVQAREAVASWLRQQNEVLDAGILDDGNIWITYKIGVDCIISTAPHGMNGSSGLDLADRFPEEVYSSVSTDITPGNRKAIVLSPFYSQPLRPNPSDEIQDTLGGLGYTVTSAYDEDVTVNLIKTLCQYGVVDWSTHGGTDFFGNVILATGEEASWLSELSHTWDIVTFRIISLTLRYDVEKEIDKDFWCIRPSFIEHYGAESYPDSLISTDACYGLANPTMADAFVNSGAYAYLGWNISVYSNTATEVTESLYHYLADGMTVSQAYENIADPTAKASFGFYPPDHGGLRLQIPTQSFTITRINISSMGAQGDGTAYRPSITGDGRFVAYFTYASNLVPDDSNGVSDAFVYDRETGETARVSVSSDGTQGNDHSIGSRISADGRFVAFLSFASNLVPNDTNGVADIFVHDRETGETARVSVSSDGTEANGTCSNWYPSISADGRWVAFWSTASNLVADDTSMFDDIFVHDRMTGETAIVSISPNESQQYYNCGNPSISADGRFIAFHAMISPSPNPGCPYVFIHDQDTGETTMVSVSSDGIPADSGAQWPAISADGRFVAFGSYASNLVLGDTNGCKDIFVHDQETGKTSRISVSSDGIQGDGESDQPAINADGRFVSFYSLATNLVSGDTNGARDIFVYDREEGTTTRISVSSDGTQANQNSWTSSINSDGCYIAFDSFASNLVPDDTNGRMDIFLCKRDMT